MVKIDCLNNFFIANCLNNVHSKIVTYIHSKCLIMNEYFATKKYKNNILYSDN